MVTRNVCICVCIRRPKWCQWQQVIDQRTRQPPINITKQYRPRSPNLTLSGVKGWDRIRWLR